MSCCRWSDNDFQCDVYVARARRAWAVTSLPPPLPDDAPVEQWSARHDKVMAMLESVPLESIDHPDAGESFIHDTPAECADNLERLRAEGFRVPQHVIDTLRAEAREME